MTCNGIDRKISGDLDGRLSATERKQLRLHLAECRDCQVYAQQVEQLRGQMRQVAPHAVPRGLATRLRVMASKEASSRRSGESRSLAASVARRINAWMGEMMRPFAIPFAGGLVSAVFLFSMLVPTMTVLRGDAASDVPTVLLTGASIKDSLPLGDPRDGLVVDLVVDESGRMVSYSLPADQHLLMDNAEIRRAVENKLLVTRFEPATFFGKPTSARLRISFRRSQIDVRG